MSKETAIVAAILNGQLQSSDVTIIGNEIIEEHTNFEETIQTFDEPREDSIFGLEEDLPELGEFLLIL